MPDLSRIAALPLRAESAPLSGPRLASHPMELPSAVRIREVGPRDGFQNEPEIIPTPEKVRLIDMLARTRVPRLEGTSFVRADVIPQLADAPDVLGAVDIPDEVSVSVLIPNERGLD